MAAATPSTWTWTGATSTAWATSTNWMPTGVPAAGDTADDPGGTHVLTFTGHELDDNTLNLSGGATLAFDNGSTLDGGSTLNGILGTVAVTGLFTDIGNIQVVSGDTLVVSIASGGTLLSDGLGGLDIGINNGGPGEFNGGTLYVLGGTLDNQEVHVNGGYADVTSALMNNDELSIDGGVLEIAQQSTVSPSGLVFVNANTAVSSTLKFDSPALFNGDGSGQISGFETGDTIDIGANTIGTLIYSAGSGFGSLTLENASGSTIFSATLDSGDTANFQSGTFAVGSSGGTAGSFQITQGSGDTLITEAATPSTGNPPENFTAVNISDVLFEDNTSGGVALWNMQNGTATAASTLGTLATGATVAATGDFFGNGRADILTENTSGQVSEWQIQNGTVEATTKVGTTDPATWSIAGAGDLYGSGTDSVVFVDKSNGDVAQWEVQSGTAVAATTVGVMGSGWSLAAVGNLSGSGDTDNLLFISSTGAVADWTVSNGVATSATSLGQTSAYWSIAGIGDFTGNGQNDILFRGDNNEIAMWTMQNGTVSGVENIGVTSADWQIVGIGDYAGTGTDDILFENTSGALAAWMMNGGTIQSVTNVGATTSAWDVVPSHPLVST